MIKPLKYYNNNLCGTEVLLESMVAHGVDKIVFSSTAATYGEPSIYADRFQCESKGSARMESTICRFGNNYRYSVELA